MKRKNYSEHPYAWASKLFNSKHRTILVLMLGLTATPMPTMACAFTVEKVQSLNFGEVVSQGFIESAWIRIHLDGSYELSSQNLTVQPSSIKNDVRLGHAKVIVEDALEGSVVEIRVVSTNPQITVYPDGFERYPLFATARSGVFDVFYGGELRFDSNDVGAMGADIEIEIHCADDAN